MRIKTELGTEYAQAYRRQAIDEIISWAIVAHEGLKTQSEHYDGKDNALSANLATDAEVYNQAALSLIAIKRAIIK